MTSIQKVLQLDYAFRRYRLGRRKERNKQAHNGLGFEVAQYVFSDMERIERFDQSAENTSGEERWQTLGKVGSVFFVVYTERGDKKRIISARAANKAERRSYNGYYHTDSKGWSKAT
ncbi:MAG: BrnT family toxin [Treponema sp.]|nr:BrnT family toxin [Treponema sp.]